MRHIRGAGLRAGVAFLAAIILASCASYEYERARELTPTGSPFTQALYNAYLDYSADAYEQDNEELSNAFAMRAVSAAAGTVVAPVTPDVEALGEYASRLQAFSASRAELMDALRAGRTAAPELSAQAQAAYDCWYLRTIDPDSDSSQATACQVAYTGAINALKAAVQPPAPAVTLPDPASFTAYFGFDEWFLRAEALDTISDAMEAARVGGHGEIVLGGHTDTSGPAEYNDGLSLRRAEAVKATMVELGAVADAIRVIPYGETDLAVPTPDGVREPLNRRVTIDLVP